MTNSFLTNNQFTLTFPKISKAVLYLQKVNIPGLSIGVTEVGTPFSFMKEADTKIQFENLICQFKLDENFDGYLEIYNWIKGLGFSQSFDEYKTLKGEGTRRENIFTDVILTIYDNSSNPFIEVVFSNAFPIQLSSVEFDSTVNESVFIDVEAAFSYDYSNINRLS